MRDADARIADVKAKCNQRVVLLCQAHMHADFTLLSELNSIADKVDKDLAQPTRVSLQKGRHLVVYKAGVLKSLFVGPGRNHIIHVFAGNTQVEINYLQIELTGLYLGYVQNVVNDVKQRVGTVLNCISIALLLGGKLRVKQHLCHAQHPVHGGADFMRHVGQKLAFGLICIISLGRHLFGKSGLGLQRFVELLGRFFGLLQIRFCFFTFFDFMQRLSPELGDFFQLQDRLGHIRDGDQE